ncbi:MAG: mechanosensitive ion channel protein MscS, partial [Cyanobacteria bacterium K_DeepCast_35m_m2_023]|nr:mechanosensitive ion channel protein MscS [Cyanobacteria bacterium K_DeepCast_35m_m2_023]
MRDLLFEAFGWLAYLERPQVLLQLVVVLTVVIGSRLGPMRTWWPRGPRWLRETLGAALLLAISAGLLALGWSFGLALLLGQLWLGWVVLRLLVRWLARWLPEDRLHQLSTRLLKPGYLLASALLLIEELDSLKDLAVIPVGQFLGVSIALGRVFNAVLVVYLVLVGCGPPAAGLAWLMQRAVGISDSSRKATELMLHY